MCEGAGLDYGWVTLITVPVEKTAAVDVRGVEGVRPVDIHCICRAPLRSIPARGQRGYGASARGTFITFPAPELPAA